MGWVDMTADLASVDGSEKRVTAVNAKYAPIDNECLLYQMTTDVALHMSVAIAERNGGLLRWTASRPISQVSAELILTPTVYAKLAHVSDNRDSLREAARKAFDQFLELGSSVHRLFDNTWGRLGVAQMKILAPNPGSRLVGAFVDPQLFVGIRLYWRDELPHKPRAQSGVIDYRRLGEEVATEWDALLPGVRRLDMKDFDNG